MLEFTHAGCKLILNSEKKTAKIIGPSPEAADVLLRKAVESGIRLDLNAITLRTVENASLVLLIRGDHLTRIVEKAVADAKPKKKASLKTKIMSKIKEAEKIEAAGVLVFAANSRRFLLQVRSPHVLDPEKIGIFGGRVEPGESPINAARRAVASDTGIPIEDPDALIKLTAFEADKLVFHTYLLVVRDEFSPTLNAESTAALWLNAVELKQTEDILPNVAWTFSNDRILRDLISANPDPKIDFEKVVEQIISG